MNKKNYFKIGIAIFLIFVALIIFLIVKSAGFERFKKNIKSSYGNGIKREIIIYNSSGIEIFRLNGKFDFTYDNNCIEYIDTNTNLKHNIFPGDNATVIINELE